MDIDDLSIERSDLKDRIDKINDLSDSDVKILRQKHFDENVEKSINVAGGRYKHRAELIYTNGIKETVRSNPDAKILNVGCGEGQLNFFYWIYKNNLPLKNCSAVDAVPEYLETHALYGIDTYMVHFEKEDILEHITDKFDIIICSEVLEHISQRAEDKFINFFKNALNEGGVILLTYPFPKDCQPFGGAFGHIRAPSSSHIENQLSSYFQSYETGEFFLSDVLASRLPSTGRPKKPSVYQKFSGFLKN